MRDSGESPRRAGGSAPTSRHARRNPSRATLGGPMSRSQPLSTFRRIIALVLLGTCASPVRSPAFRIYQPAVHEGITQIAAMDVVSPKTTELLAERVQETDHTFKTEPRAHFDGELIDGASKWVADRLNLALDYLPTANKEKALEWLGVAFHGIQDFYSHTNWVENTRNSAVPRYESRLLKIDGAGYFQSDGDTSNAAFTTSSTPALVCAAAPGPVLDAFRYLTSGYYPDNTAPATKCSHHQMNKDYVSSFSFGYENPRGAATCFDRTCHDRARSAATSHTAYLLEEVDSDGIQTALRRRYGDALGAAYFDYLRKDQADMLFLVNITPSMAVQMGSVKASINQKVQAMAGWSTS